jgi:hypothetical protein
VSNVTVDAERFAERFFGTVRRKKKPKQNHDGEGRRPTRRRVAAHVVARVDLRAELAQELDALVPAVVRGAEEWRVPRALDLVDVVAVIDQLLDQI